MKRILTLAAFVLSALGAHAQSSAFNYQGSLSSGGAPASGNYDVEFRLFDAATNGNLVGGPFTNSPTAVSNGVFNAAVSFAGTNAFPGADRWVSVSVRSNTSGPVSLPFVTLTPRQKVLALPYSITSLNGVAEAARAQAAEYQMSINLNDESYTWRVRSTNTDITISNEVGRAFAAEAAVRLNLTNENIRALAAESNLVGSVSVETSRALAVEGGFNSRLVTVETVFPPLSLNLTNEVLRAKAAESNAAVVLDVEVTRSTAAEATLTQNLNNEVARALAVEATLVTNVNTLSINLNNDHYAWTARADTNELNLNSEVVRAKAAEAAVSNSVPASVSSETSRALTAEITLSNSMAWLKSGSNATITGNVGIGITNPGTALAVAGDADIKGSVRVGTFPIISISTNVPTAGSTLIPVTGYVKLAPASAVTLAAPLTIAAAAVPGTVLILQGTDNIKTVTIPNVGNVSMSAPRTLGANDILIVLWIGDRWVQQDYTDN